MAEILDGMTTIHTWIRSQALFRAKPNVSVVCLNNQNLKADIPKDDDDEDVVIRLTSKDPHKCKNIVRFNHTTMEFDDLKLR